MSKFPPPKFFATDKDIHDLLTRLSAENLIQMAKSRGMIVSHNSQKDFVVSYLSKQMYSLPQLQSALKLMEREDKEEKTTPSKLDTNADIPAVAQAFETVRDQRKDPDERMQITQRASGELEVKMTYTRLDFSQTTLRQRTTKDITFLVQKSGDIVDFSYNNNAKAAEIYSEVKAILKGEEPIKIMESVSLKGIHDSGRRIQFFLDLMNGITGFRLRTVRDVKAERIPGIKTQTGVAEEDTAAEEDTKEEVEEMVKKMALNGGSVWTSPEFQSMVNNGFFVYNARWLGTEIEGETRTIEFDAGFSTGECADFSVRVLGVYKRNDDGSLERKITALSSLERESLRSLVHNSAFEAAERVRPQGSEASAVK